MYEFETLEELQEVLEKLAGGDLPYVVQMPRRPGQKEVRYMHLVGGIPDPEEEELPEEPARRSVSELENRVAILEQELKELKEAFDKLMKN